MCHFKQLLHIAHISRARKTAFDLFDQEGLKVSSAHTQEGTNHAFASL